MKALIGKLVVTAEFPRKVLRWKHRELVSDITIVKDIIFSCAFCRSTNTGNIISRYRTKTKQTCADILRCLTLLGSFVNCWTLSGKEILIQLTAFEFGLFLILCIF